MFILFMNVLRSLLLQNLYKYLKFKFMQLKDSIFTLRKNKDHSFFSLIMLQLWSSSLSRKALYY